MGSQQQGDGDYEEYQSDNRLVPAPRSYGDRQRHEGGQQTYDEVSLSYHTWRHTNV